MGQLRKKIILNSSSYLCVSMNRARMIKQVREMLARCGFFVSEDYGLRGVSFDIICRRDDVLLVLKVLVNIDGFSKDNAAQMRTLAELLRGTPVVIGERCGAGALSEGIIYLRHDIPILKFNTMKEYFEQGVPPFIFAAPGGLYAKIDPEMIKKARQERGLSLGALADIAGVSRKAIQMYENGTMGATLPVVDRLERFLGEPIVTALNPFARGQLVEGRDNAEARNEDTDLFRRGVFDKLAGLGYNVVPTRKCPFDAISEGHLNAMVILTGVGQADGACLQRARVIANISRITEKEGVLFLDRIRSRENIGGTPVISREELRRIKDEDRIVKLIQERK
jgi:putative transcriptional regulator